MAKVAFDVQGTLKGPHSRHIIDFFKYLQARGHEMYIWSFGGYSMAVAAKRSEGLDAECMDKIMGPPGAEDSEMDACVDDEIDCYLSAKHIIHVREVALANGNFDELAKKYGL